MPCLSEPILSYPILRSTEAKHIFKAWDEYEMLFLNARKIFLIMSQANVNTLLSEGASH